jgi:indole-3-acetate monooxygenase
MADQGGGQPLVGAARELAGRAAELAGRIERERALPRELVDGLIAAGLTGMCLPRALGGREAEPAEMVLALEELARGDGATAWCAMIASTSGLLGGFLAADEAASIYAGGRAVTGGVFAPRGRAERREDGFLVSGRWPFTSGVGHCDWVMGGCVVLDGGQPELLAKVIDTWAVSGLRGTGSHDIAVSEQLVPASRSVSVFSDRPSQPGPLYRFPLFGLLALGVASVALGIARGALEDLIDIAGAKTPEGSSKALARRAVVQSSVAQGEAQLRAARALMLDAANSAWQSASAGEPLSVEQRLGLRLAATHTTQSAAEVATAMYHAGGASSIYDSSPLQRRLRDVHVATQHVMIAPPTWELAGRLLLGLETDTTQL